jgi:zinc protease
MTQKAAIKKKIQKSNAKSPAGAAQKTERKVERKSAPKSVTRQKLKNGLSVLLLENHKSPVVSVQMWVKTGSADEQKGEEGISHFIEHLVFKGTDKYKVGEIASTVEASGGELNAYTSFDQTVFYVNISREFSDIALDVISEMMGFPEFDATEIDNEREVVIEEIKRSNDSPSRQASRLLFSTEFKTHPYGIPVIGYDKIIKKVSRKTLVDYYQSRYIPSNMHLVVAGDFVTKDMAAQIDRAFGRIKTFKLRKVTRKKELPQTQPRLKVEKMSFEEAQFHMAWRIPGASHKDTAALDVLALIFGQGESSRLAQKLRMEEPLTTSIGAGTFTPKDNGLFTVSGSLNAEQIGPAMAALQTEFHKILSEIPLAHELKKAITNFESEEFYAMETIEGIARKAGSFENLMGDYAYFQKFLKQVYALKPEDILRVARKYLTPQGLTIVMTVPRNEKAVTREMKSWIAGYKKSYLAAAKMKAKTPKGEKKFTIKKVKWSLGQAQSSGVVIEKHTLPSGATVIFSPNHATPVLSAKAAFLGGLRVEPDGKQGLTELLSRVWTSGTKDLNEVDIQNKMDNLAGGISAFGGRNSAGLSLQSISPFEAESMDLFSELLVAPVIADSIVDREKVMMLETLKSREDNPSQLVSQSFIETMFKGHPYEKDLYGTPESVNSLTKKAVLDHLGKMSQAKNLMVVVAGAVNQEKWLDRLTEATAQLPTGKSLTSNFKHQGPQQEIKTFRKLEREQSHIIIGYKGLTLNDPKRYVLQIMQSILAGQGGRLFMELRDKASLAYSVSPMRMEGIDTGYFGAYIGCSPNKGEKAIEMLKIEFDKLVNVPVGDAELDRAKRYLIGRHDIDLQRNSAISSSILFNEIYGIKSDEVFRYGEFLKSISAADVQSIAKQIFSGHAVMCAVGTTQPWK